MGSMEPLGPPYSFHVSAADGWVGLGNRAEAEAELSQLPPELARHPDVLEVRWAMAAQIGDWEGALAIADELMKTAPTRVTGWLHRAYALRRIPKGSVREAWEALLPAWQKFPEEPTVPYNLACYACQMNLITTAREWLQRAMLVGGKDQIKAMALGDPDLEVLWDEIPRL